MPETTPAPGPKPSPIGHVEIPAADFAKTKDFYARVFRWEIQDVPGYGNFAMFRDGGVGGAINGCRDDGSVDIRPYVTVDDIAATLAGVEAEGGKVLKPKTEIGGDFGFFAEFEDPNGTRVGLWSAS